MEAYGKHLKEYWMDQRRPIVKALKAKLDDREFISFSAPKCAPFATQVGSADKLGSPRPTCRTSDGDGQIRREERGSDVVPHSFSCAGRSYSSNAVCMT
jgi:hypothetical protein